MTAGRTRGTPGAPDQLADKGVRLFEFLTELQRLRTKVVRTLDSYPSVLWYADLPTDPRIATPLTTGADDTSRWLVVDRVEREDPPAPPDVVSPWLTRHAPRAARQRSRSTRVGPTDPHADRGRQSRGRASHRARGRRPDVTSRGSPGIRRVATALA